MIDTKDLTAYKQLPVWSADNIPNLFLDMHNTKVGTWGKLTILEGMLDYFELDEEGEVVHEARFDSASSIPFVEPQVWHRIKPASSNLRFYLTFYCQKEDYFAKKYHLTKTHSEVIFSAPYLKEHSRVLDLGCGQGRNALYLTLLGHDVTAVDKNAESLAFLEDIASREDLSLTTKAYDIATADISGTYDFIVSTVVLMFLDAERIPDIIHNMQEHTTVGGYNLIVCAMDTKDYPCPMPFPFTFKEGELKDYYKDWELLKYNENVGELHRLDENGNRIQLRFATMLARKVN